MAKDMLQEWVNRHDELTLEGDEIHHEGHRIGVQFDAEAAPSSTMKALDGDWLIIAGSRSINELDGPLPDDSY